MEYNLKQIITRIQQVSDSYANKFDIERDNDWYMHKLTEELGELVKVFLSRKGQNRDNRPMKDLIKEFEDELCDVFCHVLLLAKKQNIDLAKVLERKWFKHLT